MEEINGHIISGERKFINGYIQVEINGKKVGLKFNMYALEMISDIIGKQSTHANIVKMIWAGVLANCFVKQIEPEITFEEIVDWVEELSLNGDKDGVIQKVSEVFSGSQVMKKLTENIIETEDTKKKKIGTKSTA